LGLSSGGRYASSRSTTTRGGHRAGVQPLAFAAAGVGEHVPVEPGEHEVAAAVDATFVLDFD
jgi:hypothetical protein